jgi:hypothetical protein
MRNTAPAVVTTLPGGQNLNKFFIQLNNTHATVAQTDVTLLPGIVATPTTGSSEIYGIGSLQAGTAGEKGASITLDSAMYLNEAEINKMFINTAFRIKSVQLNTNNVENYNSFIKVRDYRNKMFGNNPTESRMNLQSARVNVGNGYGDTIFNFPINLTKDKWMDFSFGKIQPSSYVRIEFTIEGIGDLSTLRQIL